MDNKCVYINFSVPITTTTACQLIDTLVTKVPDDIQELHLLLNSPGGSVPVALGIANFLESLPCNLITYNISRCNSAAIMLFVAGKKRYCVPEGTFLAHSVNIENAEEQSKRFSKSYWKKMLAVFIFVAIPLPLTGVWTGTCVAVIIGLKY